MASSTVMQYFPLRDCGLAGGNWERIAPIISQTLSVNGVAVTVYDFD